MTVLLALLVLSQSPNTDAEIFIDRGETYLRAGRDNGLAVGTSLEVVDAKSRQPVGTAVVMEVWEAMARVSLDHKAAAHAPLKVARVTRSQEPVAAQPPAAVPPATLPPGSLEGRASMTGVGDMRRILIKNSSTRDWHGCDVRLANGKHYWIGDLDAGDEDGIMLFRFELDKSPPVPKFEGVTVLCREGVGRFPISL